MKQNEHKLQVGCVAWFRYSYPKHLIFAIPNGGQRNTIVASKMKTEGVLAGVPDLCIPVARDGFHGLYVELKTGKNKLTQNQQHIIQKLQNEGYKCEICYSFDDFVFLVNNYLKIER